MRRSPILSKTEMLRTSTSTNNLVSTRVILAAGRTIHKRECCSKKDHAQNIGGKKNLFQQSQTASTLCGGRISVNRNDYRRSTTGSPKTPDQCSTLMVVTVPRYYLAAGTHTCRRLTPSFCSVSQTSQIRPHSTRNRGRNIRQRGKTMVSTTMHAVGST